MNLPQRDISSIQQPPDGKSVLREISDLLRLDATTEGFIAALLASQCRLAGADAGALLRSGGEHRLEILAHHPPQRPGGNGAKWLSGAGGRVHEVMKSGETAVLPGPPSGEHRGSLQRHTILVPIQKGGAVRAVAAFLAPFARPGELAVCREKLEITPFLLSAFEMRRTLDERHAALDRLRVAIETLSAVNGSRRFASAAMALCNESAVRLHCTRVSLGFLHGRYVRIQAMSHTDKFAREMKFSQDIEAAMEECLDQDSEVLYPAIDPDPCVTRAAARFSRNHGPSALLSLPLRHDGEVHAVLTLERPPERPFLLGEIELLRLICDLCTPRLLELREHERWIGARAAASVKRGLGKLIGPNHTLPKLWGALLFSMVLFLTLAKGEYRVEAPFAFETPLQQAVVAPFETLIKDVFVTPGDEVEAGRTVLGVLDTSEVRLKLASLKAEQLGHQKKMAAFMRDQKTSEAQIAQAESDKVAAEIRLLEQHIGQATLVAPITGRVISEDLKRQIGAPVDKGKILFEVALIESLRAMLYVPEEDMADVECGQKGELASVGHPDQRIGFVLESIIPVADVVNHRNVFKVRARLLDQRGWMRPGMEGMAKISVGRSNYVWIASREAVNWVRMKLWI